MSRWNAYRETMAVEPAAYDFARQGDLRSLLAELRGWNDLDRKNAKGHSMLMLAAYSGQREATAALLDLGADPNTHDLAGNSALMGAAFKGDLEIVRLLCERGADPFHRSSTGSTALETALMFGRAEAARYLAERTRSPHRPLAGFLRSWTAWLSRAFA